MTAGPPPINVADPDLYATTDGLETLGYLQREHPVFWNVLPDGSGFWVLTRYADAVTVYRNPGSFSTRHGIQVGQAGQKHQPGADKMLVLSDRGDHRRIKAVVSRHLTPAALQRLQPALSAATRHAVAERIDAGTFDFMTEVAAALTLTVLGNLLGIPPSDWRLVSDWTDIAFGSTAGERPNPPTELDRLEANANLFAYFVDLLTARRRAPTDDLIGALARPVHGAQERLSDEEILFNVHLLLAGGHETTRQALAGAVVALHQHPDALQRLRQDTNLVPTAAEEVIRWAAPSLNVMRTATRDIAIGGQQIRAGDQVTMWNPILNRDEDEFPHALLFDVARTPNRHLSFGMGSHFCLGAWTARQELQVLLQELAAQVGVIEIAGSVRRTRSNRTWGYDHLPVQFRR